MASDAHILMKCKMHQKSEIVLSYQVSNLPDLLSLKVQVRDPVEVVGLLLLGQADEALGDAVGDLVGVQNHASHWKDEQ